jgi:D-alanyl-D-alanine carboxypeptidase (penicillin-binding protein 5/6)
VAALGHSYVNGVCGTCGEADPNAGSNTPGTGESVTETVTLAMGTHAAANGWKNEEHYTTAHDLVIITAKCLENEQLRGIAVTKKYTAPATNLSGEREMKNYLLHVTENPSGLTGGKTGTWDDDDCAVVFSFSQEGLEGAAVVIGDTEDGRPEDVKKLMAFSHEVTPGFIVPSEGAAVETAWVRHGEKTRTTLTVDGRSFAYPKDNDAGDIRTEAEYEKIEAPVKKGQEVGKFLIYADDKLIGEHKLLATEDIEEGWFPSYIYISNAATLNALKVIGLFILLLLLVSLISRNIRRRKKKNRSRNRNRQTANTGAQANQAKAPTSRPAVGSRKEKKETRKRLREKYRSKH